MSGKEWSAIDIRETERGAVIDWLQRRARMCRDEMKWYQPIRRIWLRHLATTFQASAICIKECAHLAPTLDAETDAIRRALRTPTKAPDHG